jgi:hypothetical protein
VEETHTITDIKIAFTNYTFGGHPSSSIGDLKFFLTLCIQAVVLWVQTPVFLLDTSISQEYAATTFRV